MTFFQSEKCAPFVFVFNDLRTVSVVDVWVSSQQHRSVIKQLPILKNKSTHSNRTAPSRRNEKDVFSVILRPLILLAWLSIVGSYSFIPSECFPHRWSEPNELD